MPAAPNAVADFYRARLATGSAALVARVGRLWSQLFDPTNIDASIANIAAVAATWVTGAQAGAIGETLNFLRAYYSASTGLDLVRVAPFAPLPGLVGSAANGATIGALLGITPSVYWARKNSGLTDQLAADSSLAWVNRVAASEPSRVANQTTLNSAQQDRRFTGRVIRLTRSTACAFCASIANDGYTAAHAGFAAHAHCHCTPGPEVR